jgi:hypothetical protein
MNEELLKRKKKKKKRLEDIEIEEEGTHPVHEKYTKEGIVKEG